MADGEGGKRRRGPPDTGRRRTPPSQTTPDEGIEGGEWYDDVVDESESGDGGFGGFAVKRPQMSSTDQVESQQLERYFEKQYHGKSDKRRESIEENWDESESEFEIKSLLNGYRSILLGVQSLMTALPMVLISMALLWGGKSVLDSMEGSTGAFLNIVMVFLAICLTTIAMIQIIVSAVNQSLREREIAQDGQDIALLGWSGSLRLSGKLFSELILTFISVWFVLILGLFLIEGAMPDLSLPSLDPDNISVGTIFYFLATLGSIFTMIGIIPFSIEATIKKS
jgi:hypothetical protein